MRDFFPAFAAALIACAAPFCAAQEDPAAQLFQQDEELVGGLEAQAGAEPPAAGDAQELCVHFHKRGMANARLGRYEQAVADLRQALSLNQTGKPSKDFWCERWRIEMDLSSTLNAAGDHFAQLDLLRAMGAEWQPRNPRRYFFTQLYQINAYVTLGMLKEAEETFRRATELLPGLRLRKDWRTEEHSVTENYNRYAAWMQELRGNYSQAERYRREALNGARKYLSAVQERHPPEHQLVRMAKANVTSATRQLAANLSTQGKLGEAEYHARLALSQTLSYAAFNTAAVSNVLAVLGSIKLQQARIAEAERFLSLALQALEGAGGKPYSTALAYRRAQMAFVLGVQGRWKEAVQLFEKRDQGLRGSREQFARYGSRHIDWGMALLRTGQTAQAADMLQRQLDYHQKKLFVDPVFLAQLKGYLACALAAQGSDTRALALFREALLTLIRQTQEDAGNENSGYVRLYRLRLILESYLELLARMHESGRQPAGLDAVAEAFMIADIARGSAVQRAVTASVARANLPDPQLAGLARRDQDALNRIQSLSNILGRLASAPEQPRLEKVIADMRGDIAALEAEHATLGTEIARRFPDYASLIDPQPALPADLQKVLRPDEAAISIYLGERQAYVWTLTDRQSGFRVIPVPREQIVRDVASIRRSLDVEDGRVKDFDTAAAQRLYATLLAPDAGLWAAAGSLNVIPHGALGQLPFALLLTETVAPRPGSYAELPWLIRKVAIAQLPSANALLALRRSPPAGKARLPFIGFGDPLFSSAAAQPAKQRGLAVRSLSVAAGADQSISLVQQAQQAGKPLDKAASAEAPRLSQAFSLLSALPDTNDELRDIVRAVHADPKRDLFLREHATEHNVKSAELSRYRVVAFATHGLVPGELQGLDQPALALANPALTKDSENDGFLTMEEVLGLKLNADWVVLSACNTAGGDEAGSEALSGLGRAFFFAGTRSLLVSNWAVETVSARLLTTGLFRQQAANPGLTRAEALRQSMLELMKSDKGRYAHPVFWAPFSLVGDGMN